MENEMLIAIRQFSMIYLNDMYHVSWGLYFLFFFYLFVIHERSSVSSILERPRNCSTINWRIGCSGGLIFFLRLSVENLYSSPIYVSASGQYISFTIVISYTKFDILPLLINLDKPYEETSHIPRLRLVLRASIRIAFVQYIYNFTYSQTSNISAPTPQTYMFLAPPCSCLCSIHWSQVLSWEWICSSNSADRRCSNYIWVINKFIVY